MAKVKFVVGVACALVGACGGGRSGWTVTSQPDPMTDVRITKASTRFSGEQFDAEVEIACNSKGGIHYSFTTFDKSGNPADITSKPVFGREALVFAVRQDDRAATPMWTSNPRTLSRANALTDRRGAPPRWRSGSISLCTSGKSDFRLGWTRAGCCMSVTFT